MVAVILMIIVCFVVIVLRNGGMINMSLLSKIKSFVENQRIKQFENEKLELERLKVRNIIDAEKFKVRSALKKERDKAKKFDKNPLDDGDSSFFSPSNDFRSRR